MKPVRRIMDGGMVAGITSTRLGSRIGPDGRLTIGTRTSRTLAAHFTATAICHAARSPAPIPITLVAAVALLSCGDPASPTGRLDDDPGAVIVVEPREALLGIGNEVRLADEVRGLAGVYFTIADGIRSTPGVVWKSSNPSIVTINDGPPNTAVGLSEGKAELTATFGALSARIPVTVRASANPLVITDFHVLEEQQVMSAWSYAPKLRLASATQRPAAAIVRWEVTIPGTSAKYGCRSNVTLAPGVMFEMFGEAYGDYAFSFGLSQGPVPPEDRANIRVEVRTVDGGIVAVRDSGPVVRATRPPAYAGSVNPQLCLFP